MQNDCRGAAKPSTRLDYGRRIARAMALIAADPARSPTLEELAGAAAFSPFHFHRIYRELTGETPAETLARLRLSQAAVLLVRDGLPVAVVAARPPSPVPFAPPMAFRRPPIGSAAASARPCPPPPPAGRKPPCST